MITPESFLQCKITQFMGFNDSYNQKTQKPPLKYLLSFYYFYTLFNCYGLPLTNEFNRGVHRIVESKRLHVMRVITYVYNFDSDLLLLYFQNWTKKNKKYLSYCI